MTRGTVTMAAALANLLLLVTLTLTPSHNTQTLALPLSPPLPSLCYWEDGDYLLGLLTGFYYPGQNNLCDSTVYPYAYISLQYYEAFTYAIKQVNDDDKLLPNVTLGFVIHDSCWADLAALAKAQYFVPDDASESCSAKNETTPVPDKYCGRGLRRFSVLGVVDPPSSGESELVAPLLGLYKIPVLSTQATSDSLSEKSLFQYFSRLVPPDSMLIDAIFDLLAYYNWSYVAVVFSPGPYGENASKETRRIARERGVCTPVFAQVTRDTADEVARKMKIHLKAKVVITFLSEVERFALYDSLDAVGLTGYFQWVAGDILVGSHDGPRASGTIVAHQVTQRNAMFESYFRSLTALNSENPWLPLVWENYFGCRFSADPNNNTCEPFLNATITDLYTPPVSSLYMDAVLVYAHALHNLIVSECPRAFADKALLETCVEGSLILKYMRNVSFLGYNGVVEFDEKGDRLGAFSFKQYVHSKEKLYTDIAFMDKIGNVFHVQREKIQWVSGKEVTKDPPVSICSSPCNPKQYKVQLDLPCCWQCLDCAVYARLNENQTGCDACRLLTWPDAETNTKCEPIEPSFLRWEDSLSLSFLCMGLLGVLVSLTITAWNFVNRKHKLVKASSLQLSYIILLGTMAAFLGVIPHVAEPSTSWCVLREIWFNLPVTLIYAPLLVKTVRIYRIFKSGTDGNVQPKLIGNQAQMIFTAICIGVQVAISAFCEIAFPSESQKRMRIPTVKDVELFCDIRLRGFLPPACFNLLLIAGCACCGCITRKLPENFRESWYIFVAVSTTLFMWLVFLPIYFTSNYAIHQVVMRVSCLMLMASVTVVGLFLPKIYAVAHEQHIIHVAPGPPLPSLSTRKTDDGQVPGRSGRLIPRI